LFFERHHEFDRVETVGTEVVDEARILDYLLGIDAEMLYHDLLYPFCDIAHLNLGCLSDHTHKGPSPAGDRFRPAHGTGGNCPKDQCSIAATCRTSGSPHGRPPTPRLRRRPNTLYPA